MSENILTQSEVKRLFDYCPDSGILTWKNPIKIGMKPGTKAGVLINKYIYVQINKKRIPAHRIIWLWLYGEMPKRQIDHINHNRSDNRKENLRLVTPQENTRNASLRKDNKSGVVGVREYKSTKKWEAQIRINEKNLHLGLFENFELAAQARKEAEAKYGFHLNHGRSS